MTTIEWPKISATMAAVVLTAIGGYVDAIGYLRLENVYVANMSGNSVALGIHTAWMDWAGIWRHGWPIFSYVTGLLTSRLIVTWGIRRKKEWTTGVAFAVEFAALSSFLAVHSGWSGVFVCALAMGVQAATVSRFDGINIYTCFVTGTLVRMGSALADVLWSVWDSLHGNRGAREALRENKAREAVLFAGNWIAYLAGAAAGTLALGRVGVHAIAAPIVLIGGFALVGFYSPGFIGNWNAE